MKNYAMENEMEYAKLLEMACFDFHPMFSEWIEEIKWERLGITEDDDYDFCCEEYQSMTNTIYKELVNA